MRRWGYWLGGLMALAVIAGALSPEQAEPQGLPAPSQSQTAAPAQDDSSAQPTEASTEQDAGSEPNPEPSEESTQTPEPSPTPTRTAAATAAAASGFAELLAQLEIEDEFQGGYDRDLFSDWIDADRDGCDARREVLIIEAVVSPVVGSRCSLEGGSWYSAFDGATTTVPRDFDIDHMVPLKEAWDSGAHAWDRDRRRAFSNDLDLPEALIAVSASSNRSKSDRDPAEWLPPLRSYHCQYVRDWMVVKIKWELSVDAREFTALRNVAAGC